MECCCINVADINTVSITWHHMPNRARDIIMGKEQIWHIEPPPLFFFFEFAAPDVSDCMRRRNIGKQKTSNNRVSQNVTLPRYFRYTSSHRATRASSGCSMTSSHSKKFKPLNLRKPVDQFLSYLSVN